MFRLEAKNGYIYIYKIMNIFLNKNGLNYIFNRRRSTIPQTRQFHSVALYEFDWKTICTHHSIRTMNFANPKGYDQSKLYE
jgi:hypothetical protein